jgi:hypothetical protein
MTPLKPREVALRNQHHHLAGRASWPQGTSNADRDYPAAPIEVDLYKLSQVGKWVAAGKDPARSGHTLTLF